MVRDPLPIGAHGVITVRRLRVKTWRARTYFRDERGVRRDVTAQAATRAAAETKLKLKLSSLPAAGQSVNASITISEAAERWLGGLDSSLSTNTVRNYRLLAAAVSRDLGSLQLREATAGGLDSYLGSVSAPSARHNRRLVLRMIFDEAVRLGAVPYNPVLSTRSVKGTKKTVQALSLEQVQQLRSLVSGDLADLVDVLLGTGCRWGEGAGLRWEDVDLDAGTVTVNGTLIHGAGWQPDTKTHQSRTLQVPVFVLKVLQRRRAHAAAGAVFVFEFRGAPLKYNSSRAQLKKALAGSGLEWVTWHVLRKTTATHLDQVLGLSEASVQLGHASEAMTRAAYVARSSSAAFAEALEGLVA